VGVVCSGLALQELCSGRADRAGKRRNLQSASHSLLCLDIYLGKAVIGATSISAECGGELITRAARSEMEDK